jgi:hypothetical protein
MKSHLKRITLADMTWVLGVKSNMSLKRNDAYYIFMITLNLLNWCDSVHQFINIFFKKMKTNPKIDEHFHINLVKRNAVFKYYSNLKQTQL